MSHYLNSSGHDFLDSINDCVAAAKPMTAGTLFRRLVCQLKVWDQRYQQRRQLMELDPSLLKDIGVSDAEAEAEAAKPFWRA